MQRPLDGVTLVVTRPAAQAAPFIALAQGAGARCLAFPTLRITPLATAPERIAQLRAQRWDWAVWTSSNAVEHGLAALRNVVTERHAAVGRATERALHEHGLAVAVRPDTANSEGLLASAELEAVAGQHVLLITGEGGRDLLRDTLAARGAHVETLVSYRREAEVPTDAALHALHAAVAERPIVITVTSVEVLEALLHLARPADVETLGTLPLVVPGPRVASAAQRLGWRGPVTVAATAEDAAMLAASVSASGRHPPAA